MVWVGYADVRGGACCDVGYNVVVNPAVISVKPQIYAYVWIKLLKIRDSLFVDGSLGLVGVVFCPEGKLILAGFVKFCGDIESFGFSRAVTSCKGETAYSHDSRAEDRKSPFHPFVPPLETPSIILLRKIRKMIISGMDITTTAAIMAGIFSLPNPFSRIS